MIKPLITNNGLPIRVIIKASKEERINIINKMLEKEYDFLCPKNNSNQIETNIIQVKSLRKYLKNALKGFDIKLKELTTYSKNRNPTARVYYDKDYYPRKIRIHLPMEQTLKSFFIKYNQKRTPLSKIINYLKQGPIYSFNSDNLEVLLHESIHAFQVMLNIDGQSFEKNILKYIKNDILKNQTIDKKTLIHMQAKYYKIKRHIYKTLIYTFEKEPQFNKDKFLINLNNELNNGDIRDNYLKIIFLKSFLRDIQAEIMAYNKSEAIINLKKTGDEIKNIDKYIKRTDIETELHLISKEKTIKEELIKAIKEERTKHNTLAIR